MLQQIRKRKLNKMEKNVDVVKVMRLLLMVVGFLNAAEGEKVQRNQHYKSFAEHLMAQLGACTGMFICGFYIGYEAHCIPTNQICDGHNQCEGGEDEANCPTRMPKCDYFETLCPGERRCAVYCDGKQECLSGADENKCDVTCKPGEVQCSDGKCAVVGDGNKECSDGADEDCPDCPVIPVPPVCDVRVGEISCIHKTSGQIECVSTCNEKIECAGREDEKALETCPLDCSGFNVKCELLNGRGFGCASVCDGVSQCRNYDEDLGKFPGGTDKCEDVKTDHCKGKLVMCVIFPGTLTDICCGCNTSSIGAFVNGHCKLA